MDKNYKDQLKFGDEVIRIDNHLLSEMDFCDIIKLKKNLDTQKPYEIEVRSKDNQTRTVKIENK